MEEAEMAYERTVETKAEPYRWGLPKQCPRCGSQEYIERGTMEYKQPITMDTEDGNPHWGAFESDGDSEREQSYECANCELDLESGWEEGDDDDGE